MNDALTQLFSQFSFQTDLFFVGQLCRTGSFSEENKGYLHFIRQGRCLLNLNDGKSTIIDRSCIVFSPTNVLHNIHPLNDEGVDIFCINFDFGKGVRNPLTHTLHNIAVLYLDEQPELKTIAQQIFNETAEQHCGYQMAIHHLCAYFTILVVRQCLAQNLLHSGLLKGLTDKRLKDVLLAIHSHPEYDWQVEQLAEKALMSRSQFSAYFKQIMGISPIEYLTNWRIAVAQTLLLKGVPVARVAEQVGYSHNSALTRVFSREVGLTPLEWLAQNRTSIS